MLTVPKPKYKTNFDFISVTPDDTTIAEHHDTEYSVLWSQGSIGNMQASYDEALAKRKAVRDSKDSLALIANMINGVA